MEIKKILKEVIVVLAFISISSDFLYASEKHDLSIPSLELLKGNGIVLYSNFEGQIENEAKVEYFSDYKINDQECEALSLTSTLNDNFKLKFKDNLLDGVRDNLVEDFKENVKYRIMEKFPEKIVGVAVCENKKYFLCLGGLKNCSDSVDTKKVKNILQYKSDFNGQRYRLEVSQDKLFYRIQDKACLLSYPHGCLITGFTWQDDYTFVFIYDESE